jgi:hypothetical protein
MTCRFAGTLMPRSGSTGFAAKSARQPAGTQNGVLAARWIGRTTMAPPPPLIYRSQEQGPAPHADRRGASMTTTAGPIAAPVGVVGPIRRGMGRLGAGAAVMALVLLPGCTGSEPFRAGFGDPATDLARHVTACSNVRQVESDAPRMLTSAICEIDGREVRFNSFLDAKAAKHALFTQFAPAARAYGDSWYALIERDGSDLRIQRRIAVKIAAALHGKVAIDRK